MACVYGVGVNEDELPEAVLAVRIAPGSFLLAAERVSVGLVFVVDGERFEVVGEPAALGGDRYLVTTRRPDGGQLTAQLQVGRRVN